MSRETLPLALLCLVVSSMWAWAFEISPVRCNLFVSVPCSRRFLYIVNLDAPNEGHRKISRQSKWDIGAVQWNPHDSYAYYFAASVSSLILKAVELILFPSFFFFMGRILHTWKAVRSWRWHASASLIARWRPNSYLLLVRWGTWLAGFQWLVSKCWI